MHAYIVPASGGEPIELVRPITIVGRSPSCDVQLESRKVSRLHCCLAREGDHVFIRDLDSTNGIKINGLRVREGSLAPGDELTIGDQVFRLITDLSQTGQVPAAAATAPPAVDDGPKPIPLDDEEEAGPTARPDEDDLAKASSSFDVLFPFNR